MDEYFHVKQTRGSCFVGNLPMMAVGGNRECCGHGDGAGRDRG